MRFTYIVLAALLAGTSSAVHAKMYKWVDDEGQMHFGDKIPEKYLNKEHDVLTDRGLKEKHTKAAKTPEQIAEEKRLQRESQKLAREEEKQRNLDRVLLDAYDNEQALVKARDVRLDDVAVQIQLAESIISTSNKKIGALEVQVERIKASKREVPANLYGSINREKKRVVLQNRIIAKNKKRSAEVTEKYNGYIQRFKAAKSR
jgi:hypothetical protein